MWDGASKSPFAFLLPAKGLDYLSSDLAIHHVVKSLNELGYKRIIIRSDGEPSLVAFLRAVAQALGGEVVQAKVASVFSTGPVSSGRGWRPCYMGRMLL